MSGIDVLKFNELASAIRAAKARRDSAEADVRILDGRARDASQAFHDAVRALDDYVRDCAS